MTGAVAIGAQKPAGQCGVYYSHRGKFQAIQHMCVCVSTYVYVYKICMKPQNWFFFAVKK